MLLKPVWGVADEKDAVVARGNDCVGGRGTGWIAGRGCESGVVCSLGSGGKVDFDSTCLVGLSTGSVAALESTGVVPLDTERFLDTAAEWVSAFIPPSLFPAASASSEMDCRHDGNSESANIGGSGGSAGTGMGAALLSCSTAAAAAAESRFWASSSVCRLRRPMPRPLNRPEPVPPKERADEAVVGRVAATLPLLG